jgi:hypothetical protein
VADEDSDQAAEDDLSLQDQRLRKWLLGARKSAESLSDADRASLSSQLEHTLGVEHILPALTGWLTEGPALNMLVLSSQENLAVGRSVLAVGQSVLVADPDIISPANLNSYAARAARVGINRLSPPQIFALVLMWLTLLGIPLIELQLSPDAQAVINSEAGMIGVGLAITALILQKGT